MRELTFLSKIEVSTRLRNEEKSQKLSLEALIGLARKQTRVPFSFEKAFTGADKPLVIAEIKRRSPSQGSLNDSVDPVALATGYQAAGATAVSILTEPTSFGGSLEDLTLVRRSSPDLPLLQKDFVIDPYQIYEAFLHGADAVLLIVALLGPEKTKALSELASSLGLSVLVEVHTLEELQTALRLNSKIIGINNRDLHSLKISLDVSRELIKLIPEHVIAVSESGINSAQEIRELHTLGFDAFLIGSSFMRTADPAAQLSHLLQEALRES